MGIETINEMCAINGVFTIVILFLRSFFEENINKVLSEIMIYLLLITMLLNVFVKTYQKQEIELQRQLIEVQKKTIEVYQNKQE